MQLPENIRPFLKIPAVVWAALNMNIIWMPDI